MELNTLSFPYFELELVKLDDQNIQNQKQPLWGSNLQPSHHQSAIITTTPWVEDTEKPSLAFTHAWLVLVEFD